MRLILLVELFTISIVESPSNCKWFKENRHSNWEFPYVYDIDNSSTLSVSEKKSHNFRNLKKLNWDYDAYWMYANTYTDLFMPLISDNLKEAGIDPIDVHNVSDVIWMNALLVNYTAKIKLTGGRMRYISELERQGDAYMYFPKNNFIQLNVTVINPYILCRFNYHFQTTVFPYVWHSGKLFADVTNVTSNLLLSLDLTKQVIDLAKFTLLDIESVHVTLYNNLPIFDQFTSKIVNYLLPFYKEKIIQVSEETVAQEIYMRMNDINGIFFYK